MWALQWAILPLVRTLHLNKPRRLWQSLCSDRYVWLYMWLKTVKKGEEAMTSVKYFPHLLIIEKNEKWVRISPFLCRSNSALCFSCTFVEIWQLDWSLLFFRAVETFRGKKYSSLSLKCFNLLKIYHTEDSFQGLSQPVLLVLCQISSCQSVSLIISKLVNSL